MLNTEFSCYKPITRTQFSGEKALSRLAAKIDPPKRHKTRAEKDREIEARLIGEPRQPRETHGEKIARWRAEG